MTDVPLTLRNETVDRASGGLNSNFLLLLDLSLTDVQGGLCARLCAASSFNHVPVSNSQRSGQGAQVML